MNVANYGIVYIQGDGILGGMPRINNQLKTVLLLGALSALIVAVGTTFAPDALGLFVALALAVNLGGYFFSDRIVLALHRARELGPGEAPELHQVIGELARRADIPRPRLYLIDDPQPNAFATGRNPAHGAIAVTTGILEALDGRELRGVLAHELAHIRNRDILISSIAAALASVITWVAQALSFGALFGGRDEEEGGVAEGLLFALVAPIAATVVQLGISRSREYQADETGARLTGDPEGLARALLRLESAAEVVPAATAHPATASLFIVSPLMRPGAVLRLFSTHPATDDRVARLRAMPPGRMRA
jgi:heat shock protein HtpX